MAALGTTLYTLFFGSQVGTDEFGNRYYERKRKNARSQRWCVYKGIVEPSKVPAHWHGWLHHTHDNVPANAMPAKKYRWQKEHLPNLTGTKAAYMPPGHVLRGAERAPATADYQAWKPQ